MRRFAVSFCTSAVQSSSCTNWKPLSERNSSEKPARRLDTTTRAAERVSSSAR
jgi:hypothetical protein